MAIIIESYGLEFNTLTSIKNLITTDEITDIEFDPQRDLMWDLSDEVRKNTRDLIISYSNRTSTRLRIRNNIELKEIRSRLIGLNKLSYDVIGTETDFLNLA